jgi:poly-beta-1,6-N-acetyl-D-glucosamine synthase
VKIVAIVPAHNEAEWIYEVVQNLWNQNRSPDHVIVMSDNSTDDTVAFADKAGAEVWESENNRHKKAGALNQALTQVLPDLDEDDYVFVQDADTLPVRGWIADALDWESRHPMSVVSGRYASPPTGKSLLRIIQENEFARDGYSLTRRGNRTRIVVGTSTLFPVPVLRAVISARASGKLPGAHVPDVYSVESITEDYELTLALKQLGVETYSPPSLDAVTDVMPTISALWQQRVRWQRGAFTDLGKYGLSTVTTWYYAAQAMWCFGMLTVALIVTQIIMVVTIYGHFRPAAIWIGTLPLFVAHRVMTVRRTGKKGMLVAALMVPEVCYDFFRYAVYLACAWKAVTRREAKW